MRSSVAVSVCVALSVALGVAAHSGHEAGPHARGHLRQARHRDRRAASSVLTAVPDVVTGAVTISNTQVAAAGETASAVGALKKKVNPLPSCQSSGAYGDSCSPLTGSCCDVGLTCYAGSCTNMCTADTTEAYCDDDFPCNASLGYVCTANRCRPPATAVRVANGETCDQGTSNTLFCIPAKGVCVDGTCQSCTQHS